jgi:PEP-CTERM motif
MKLNLRNLTATAAVMGALTIAAQARADVIDFFLNQPELVNGTVPPTIPDTSAVEVTVNELSPTSATVTFTAPGSSDIDTPALINVNGSANATVTLAGGVVENGNEDGFGTFSFETSAVKANSFTFDLTATNGNSFADAAAVLTPTTNFNSAFGHGFEAATAAQDAGVFTPTPVPEPSSLALFGAALAGLAVFYRRRRST